jgi:hypothetical protein
MRSEHAMSDEYNVKIAIIVVDYTVNEQMTETMLIRMCTMIVCGYDTQNTNR